MLGSYKYQLSFLKSAFSLKNAKHEINEILDWLTSQNDAVEVSVEKIKLRELKNWSFNNNFEKLCHSSGKFFSIDGIKVTTNWGYVAQWEQPIINQPEIGYLGFIVKEFNGVLHFLLQAKIEPGNVNCVQISPTLQATKSNYLKVHKGNSPSYLEYFLDVRPECILLDQLQSEQGARFLKKRNRNIIIEVKEEIEVKENFMWATLAQVKQLMQFDNIVNMDTRTVIGCISFGDYKINELEFLQQNHIEINENTIGYKLLKSTLLNEGAVNTFDELIRVITKLKCKYELDIQAKPLREVKDWIISDYTISHTEKQYFNVIAASVSISNREVQNWTQPMIEPSQEGLCAFVCKEINGLLHFIVQAKLEAGNFDIIELAPTVQCLTGNYKNTFSTNSLPYLEYVINASRENIIFDTLQSEEGGRFYKEQNRNLLIKASDDFKDELPENYLWMTLNQIQMFIKFNNYINIQARSLISALQFIK